MNLSPSTLNRTRENAAVLAAGLLLTGPSLLQADTTSFNIDPAQSSVTLSGTVVALGLSIPMKEQGPGSLSPSYSGSFVVDRSNGNIQLASGSQMVPGETGPWQPGAGGIDGNAPASYAAKASVSFFGQTVNATAATRRVVFDVQSVPLPLQDGKFSTDLLAVKFLETANSDIDYRITGALSQNGAKVLSGLLTNKVGSSGSVATVDGTETLTLPIDASYSFDVDSAFGPVTFNLNFKGQLVATAGGAPEEPIVGLSLPTAPGEPLTLVWSKSYKLQRATTLLPPDWADYATDSPVTIPTVQAGEYFQVVHK